MIAGEPYDQLPIVIRRSPNWSIMPTRLFLPISGRIPLPLLILLALGSIYLCGWLIAWLILTSFKLGWPTDLMTLACCLILLILDRSVRSVAQVQIVLDHEGIAYKRPGRSPDQIKYSEIAKIAITPEVPTKEELKQLVRENRGKGLSAALAESFEERRHDRNLHIFDASGKRLVIPRNLVWTQELERILPVLRKRAPSAEMNREAQRLLDAYYKRAASSQADARQQLEKQ
jgi:hypothetical protein